MSDLLGVDRLHISLDGVDIALTETLAIHAQEMDFCRMGRIGIVGAHPLKHSTILLCLPGTE